MIQNIKDSKDADTDICISVHFHSPNTSRLDSNYFFGLFWKKKKNIVDWTASAAQAMSESIVRKVQPFTIGTKLSVPAVPKGTEFADSFLPSSSLDNCKMQHNLNNQVSLYLGHSPIHPSDSHISPMAARVLLTERCQEEKAKEDHLNRNAVSPTASSRSIKKITISSWTEKTGDKVDSVAHCPKVMAAKSENSNNNNNAAIILPKIVGVSLTTFLDFFGKKKNIVDWTASAAQAMSESIVRKVQPFTIGTKLSVPAVPKGTEFADSFLPSSSLDNCKMQHNLNNQVSLYLGHSPIHPSDSHISPMAARVLLTERCQEEKAKEDHLNRNAVSPTASSRSIKKITISSWTEKTGDKVDSVAHCPKVMAAKSENSNNNNNAAIILPKIVGVSCESKPNSHFKPTESRAPFLRRDVPKKESTVPGNVEKHKQQSDYSLTQRITQFNREILQAETWIKGKLQDLKDGCSIQRCPLQDWEQVSQTLQRDLKDFENTMIQLNQMGEQLICKQNPTSDTVRKQLSQLKDQWQTLKQTAANQSKALGGARNLQEFNRKVDKLESWLKGKEEKQSLVVLLEENIDKMQLTRRILDLKQDEQQYRALHDEIDSLALRLEKQGKNEGKNISARRKHINKMWLKTQTLLKDYHEKLQLALEASSFSQQADNIIRATNNKRKIVCGANGKENSGDREMRDIASQIMMLDVTVSQLSNLHPTLAERVTQKQREMLDVTVSQLSNLHPTLAERVTQKQREVKNTWALLQQAVRNEKSGLLSPCSDFMREDGDPLTSTRELQCSMGKEVQRFMGKEVQEEQNRLKECVEGRSLVQAQHPGSTKIEEFLRQLEVLWEELKKRHQKNDAVLQELEKTNLQAMTVLKDLHDMGEWLKTVESSISLCALSGDPESMNAAERESSLLENEVASRGLELRALRQEVEKLRSRRHFHMDELPSKMEEVEDNHMSSIGQPLHSELGCHGSSMLVLADAGQQLIDSGRFDSDDIADPLEELREAVEMLNDTVRERGRSLTEDHGLEEQLRRLGDTIDFEVIKEEVDEMEKQAARLQVLYPERVQILGEEVQETLQAWEETGKCIAENSGRLSQALQLQDFFRNYLAMISWTEDTRTCIFSESSVNPGKEGRLPETEELDSKIEQKFQEFEELAAAGQKLIDEEHHLTEIIKERTEELRSMLGWILVRWRAQKHQRSRGKTKAEPQGDVIYSEATVCTPQSVQIKERTEELRSMLGWILVRWRAQKHQRSRGKTKAEPQGDVIYSEATVCTPQSVQGFSPCLEERYVFQERSTGCRVGSCIDRLHPQKPRHSSQSEGGYEEMTPIHPKGSELNSSGGSLEGLLVLESPESPLLVLKEPSTPSLGGTVNLILSFSKKRDSQLQLQDPMDESETQEPIHRVSTYLHVKDNKKAISPVFESVTLPRLNSKGQPKAPPVSEVSTVSFHTLPKTSSSSIFNNLKKRGKKKKQDVRRHTIQKIMGVDLSEGGAGEVPSNTNTWPLKERVKDPTIPCPASGELLDYVKNPLVKDIDAECTVVQSFSDFSQPGGRECSVKGGSTLAVSNNCKHLCLGSVLSFELPKDMNLIGNIPDLIKIQPPDTTADSLTINSLSSFCKSAKWNTEAAKDLVEDEGCSGLSTTGQDSIKPRIYEEISNQIPTGAQGQKNGGHWFKLHNPETDSSPFQPALPTTENPQNKGQDSPRGDIFDLKLKRLSRISILHEEVGHEWDKLADALDSTCRLSNQIGAVDEERQYSTTAANGYLQSSSELCQMGRSTYCELSNNEHKPDKKKGRFNEVSGFKSPEATSSKVKAQRTPHSGREVLSDSVLCNNVNVKTCSGEQTESVAIRLNRSTFKRDKETKTNKRDRTSSELGAAAVEVIHPDHQQFEEEEEELEDIWNKSIGYRQSICSDIMYQTYNQGQDSTSPAQQETTATPCQDVTYRKLVTASAPNLLVAEFRLPASIQNLLGYCKESDTGEKSPTSDHRRSWDAFPHKEQASQQIAPINETASDQVELPNVADHQKYIYKYREEEEEDTGSVKDQSMSLLSVHMGVEGNGKQPVYSEGMDCDCAEQGHTINTRGHCSIMVSTYLHVKDNKKAPVFESVTLPRLNSKRPPKVPPLSVSSMSFHTLPKTSSSSVFNSLKKRGKKKKRDVRRHSIQKIMGVDLSKGGADRAGEVTSNTNTWPLKERIKDLMIPSPASGELLDYVKNPLAKDIDAESTVTRSISGFSQPGGSERSAKEGSMPAVSNNCKRLCLGSVLSFELPKDMNLIANIPDLIKIQPPDTKTADSLTINSLSSFRNSAKWNTEVVKAPVETKGCSALSTTRQASIKPRVYEDTSNQIPTGAQGQKNGGHWFKLRNTEKDSSLCQSGLPATENPQNKGQDSPRDDRFDLKLKRLSGINILQEEVGEWDKLADTLHSTCTLSNQIDAVDEEKQHSRTAANGYSQSSSELCQTGRSTPCDLRNNEHKPDKNKGRFNEVSGFKSPQATSSKVLSESVLCNNVNIKTCSGEQTESVALRVDRSAFKRDKETKTNKRDRTSSELGAAAVEVIHPDHQQFEEEEEELEDIWNKSIGYRQSICSDIMYQTYNQGQDSTSPAQQETTATPCQDVTYRKLVTASAPNLLVAEFRLPASIQNLLGYCKESDTGEKSPTSDHRRSWDAFPHKEQASQQIAPINETASDQVELPNVADHQKYIYKYREEEEEDTGSVKDQSMSLLSVHMGVEGNGKQPVYSEGMDCDCAEQGHTINTRGHCSIMNGNKAEFESMEGTLERKHKLQLGGKRASCRTWNPYHAVLFKQSLCFYQDRKDMLQSSIAGVPLNLTGAVCSPAPDYTKKMHCFRLQCSQSAVPCSCSTACNCPHGGATTSLSSGHHQSTTAKTKEITVLTRENTKLPNRHRGHSEDLAAPLSSDAGHREDYYGSLQQSMRKKLPQRNRDASELPQDSFHTDRDQDPAVSKRRSHSFTSAAYQKITPISKPLGGSEVGPSYSVTLLIGEQLGEAKPISNSPESTLHREPQLIGWHPEILLDKPGERNYGSLPRPRNKSVFQKFFGKKE
ncbi:UNVERIFIED_CONTAM: hypothetical protein FKN15_008952 [Acipenser sinensis]